MEELSHIVTKHLRLAPYLSMKDMAILRATCKDWNRDLEAPLKEKWDCILDAMKTIVKHNMFDTCYENFDIYFTVSYGLNAGNRMRLRFMIEWRVWSIELTLLYKQGYQELNTSVLFRTSSREAFAGFFDSSEILDEVLPHNLGRCVFGGLFGNDWKSMSTYKHILCSVMNGNPTFVKRGARLLPEELVDVVSAAAAEISVGAL